MLDAPKGLKWWYDNPEGIESIKDEAPEWAKKEFEDYQELMNSKTDEDGIKIQY